MPGKLHCGACPIIHRLIGWAALLLLALGYTSQSSVQAQGSAQFLPQIAADICSFENLAKRVTAYLIQRCFDENRLFELRRAIQRRQLQLEEDNQKTATEMMTKLGIDRAMLNSLLLIVSEAEIDIENQAEVLAESLTHYRVLSRDLEQLNVNDLDGHGFGQIAAEVEAGNWTAASKLAIVMETRALAERRDRDKSDGGATREAIAEFILGQIALVRSNYASAARHFELASVYAGKTTAEGQTFSEAAADALVAEAKREWNDRALQQAIDTYRRVLDVRPRSTYPALWAQTQSKLGNAILRLGVGTNSVPLITGAVSAFEAALEVQTPSEAPAEWAMTTANLADALVQLASRLDEKKDLRDAIDAYRRLLSETKFVDTPGKWVEVQTSLGNALWSLGRHENGPRALNQAIAAFQEALTGIDRERQLRDWGATQNNIGAAFFLLAEREDPVTNARYAVAAFEASLAAYRDASALYFISGVRKNLAGAEALLQRSVAQQPQERTRSDPSVETSSSPLGSLGSNP